MKFNFSQQIFKKYLNVKFHDNQSGRSRDVPFGLKDRQTGQG